MATGFDLKTIMDDAKREVAGLLTVHPDIKPLLFEKGEFIVREGDRSFEVYVVLAGNYLVEQAGMIPGAPPITLATVLCSTGKISIIGEMAYISGEGSTRAASVKALTDVRALRLAPHHLDAVIDVCPTLTRVLCRQLVQHIRKMNEQLRQLEGADFLIEAGM